MKQINILYTAALVALSFFEVQDVVAIRMEATGPHLELRYSLDPTTVRLINSYMDELQNYANQLPSRFNPIKEKILALENRIRILAGMKARNLNRLYSTICEELDDYFKPARDYYIHSPNLGPTYKLKEKEAERKVRRVYGSIQSLWLDKIMESDRH